MDVRRNNRLPIDKGWAWAVLIAGIVTIILVEGVQKSFGILYVEFIVKFNATDAETSAIQTAYSISFSIGAILTLAVAMEMLSCRQCTILGGIILSLGPGLSIFVERVSVLYLTYGCFVGLGTASAFSSALVIIGTYFDKRRGLANGFAQAAGSLGTLVLGPVVRALVDKYGLNGALLILCGLITNIVASGAVMRPVSFYKRTEAAVSEGDHDLLTDTSSLLDVKGSTADKTSKSHETLFRDSFQDSPALFRKRSMSESVSTKNLKAYVSFDNLFSISMADLQNTKSNQIITNEPEQKEGFTRGIKARIISMFDYRIMKNEAFVRMLFAYIIGSLAVSNPIFYVPPYAKEKGRSKSDAAIFVSIYGCSDIISRMTAGWLCDLHLLKTQYLIALGLTLNGLAQFVAYWCHDFWLFAVFVALYGVLGGVMPAIYVPRLLEILGLDLLRSGLMMLYLAYGIVTGAASPFIASTAMCVLHVGIIKCFGLFLIEFLELFKEGVTKTVVIYTLINATYGILSIFVLSYGLRRFSARQIGIVGCVLCTIGFIISSFAESLSFLIFSIGIVVGCGGSLVFSPVFVMLGQYFDKRRGLANGVCASGSCLGGLLFPPLMRHLLDNYGLRGSLILIGGIYSNMFIFICLMRPLNFYKKKIKEDKDTRISLLKEADSRQAEEKVKTETDKVSDEKDLNGKANGAKQHAGFTSLINMSAVSNSESSIASFRKRTFSDCGYKENQHEPNRIKTYLSNHSLMTASSFGDPDWRDIVPPDKENTDDSNILYSLLKNIEFILFIIYNGFGSISGGLSYTFVPLFAKDFGLTNDQIVIVLIIMGVCDFIGRIVCGLIADLPQVRSIYIILTSQLIVGIVANCAVLLTSYWNFCLFVVGYGLFCGINFSLGPGLLSRIVGLEKFPIAYSISIISQQIGLGGSSPLLGYFRDSTGDYFTSFHLLGCSAFIAVVFIASEQIFQCMRKME